MQKFQSVGYVNSDPAGDLVHFSEVLNLCEELVDFISQIIDEIQSKGSTFEMLGQPLLS